MANKSKDPFFGYSSRPDILEVYISATEENQKKWLANSEIIIEEFIKKLSSFKNFQEAYIFLAKKRHDLAVQLRQRTEEGRTEFYGTFRQEGEHFRQIITAGEGKQFWKWQKDQIFSLATKLIAPLKKIEKHNSVAGYEDKFINCLKQTVSIDDRPATYYSISIKFPNDEIHNWLSKIEFFDFPRDKTSNTIHIEYTPLRKNQMTLYYQIANRYYEKLTHWKKEEGIKSFLQNAGMLSFLLAHLLLVKQGNVSIVEWMLRGIAFKQGIQLGYFNYEQKIGWDFKAILTPNSDDYVKWFSTKLFKKITLLKKEDLATGFYFE